MSIFLPLASFRWVAPHAGVMILSALVSCLAGSGVGLRAESETLKVLVLANSRDPVSEELARYYAEARGIDSERIIALPMPMEERITWEQYITEIRNPLLIQLIAGKHLKGVYGAGTEPYGIRPFRFSSHDIDFLVAIRGVPLKIKHDPSLATPLENPAHAEFEKNRASVDAELSLLPAYGVPTQGPIGNPLFQDRAVEEPLGKAVIKVARLDGPSPEIVRGLVDQAATAEMLGLRGRVYIDLGKRHPSGNSWLSTAEKELWRMDFPTAVHEGGPTMPETDRYDGPAVYLGWYAGKADGPWARSRTRFLPGAIALHIHSFSATTLRRSQRWVAPLLERGATVVMGNTSEPFLQMTHRPDLFVQALKEGRTVGEAAYFSLPVLSWKPVFLGDPLYRPFAVSLEEQVARIRRGNVAPGDEYAVIRAMRQAKIEDSKDAGLELGIDLWKAGARGPALAMEIDRWQFEEGIRNKLLDQSSAVVLFEGKDEQAVPLAIEMAAWLSETGRFRMAGEVARWALAEASLQKEGTKWLLNQIARIARLSDDQKLLRRVEVRLEKIREEEMAEEATGAAGP